jgi:aryl-alcohol dehydrogenase-like predicted oxidoreductase
VVSHPAVTCAIPGTTSVRNVESNLRAAQGALPDAAMRRRMEEYWDALEA